MRAIGHVHQCLVLTGATVGKTTYEKSQVALYLQHWHNLLSEHKCDTSENLPCPCCSNCSNVTFSEALPASLSKMGRLFLCPVVYSLAPFLCFPILSVCFVTAFSSGLTTAATLNPILKEGPKDKCPHGHSDASSSTGPPRISSTPLPCRFEAGSSYQRVLRREEQAGFPVNNSALREPRKHTHSLLYLSLLSERPKPDS